MVLAGDTSGSEGASEVEARVWKMLELELGGGGNKAFVALINQYLHF